MYNKHRNTSTTNKPTGKEVIRMYEYEIINRQTEEVMSIYGYNVANAFSRLAHLEKFATPNDWIVTNTTYID